MRIVTSVPFVHCQRTGGDDSLPMMRVNASLARTVAAIFTMAIFYASACTAACAAGFCPYQMQQTSSHACESAAPHHAHHSGKPDKPDCSKHSHPSPFFVKSAGIARFDLTVSTYLRAAVLVALPRNLSAPDLTASDGSDLAPPPASSIPLYHQISVLRI